MISIKPVLFYNFIQNTNKYLKDNKNKEIKQFITNTIRRGRVDARISKTCEDLATKCVNGHFQIKSCCILILKALLYSSDEVLYKPKEWKLEEINTIDEYVSFKRFNEDKERVDEVLFKYDLTLERLFTINENGESVIFDFLMKQYISPIFILRYKNLFNDDEKESNNHKRVRKIIHIIEKVLEQQNIK